MALAQSPSRLGVTSGYAWMRSTSSRNDDVECTGSFRRCRRRHCRIAVRAHLARLLLLGRITSSLNCCCGFSSS